MWAFFSSTLLVSWHAGGVYGGRPGYHRPSVQQLSQPQHGSRQALRHSAVRRLQPGSQPQRSDFQVPPPRVYTCGVDSAVKHLERVGARNVRTFDAFTQQLGALLLQMSLFSIPVWYKSINQSCVGSTRHLAPVWGHYGRVPATRGILRICQRLHQYQQIPTRTEVCFFVV